MHENYYSEKNNGFLLIILFLENYCKIRKLSNP